MLKEKRILLVNNLIVLVILLFNLSSTTFAQEAPKKPRIVFTSDEFSTSLPKEQEKVIVESPKTDNSIKPSTSEAKIEEIPDPDLQFRALDIQLALAQDPNSQTLRQQQIDINTQLRQASLVKPSINKLRDLAFKQRYIELKISLINLERHLQEGASNIQKERRKIIRGSRGNSAFEGVRAAEDNLDNLQKDVIELQIKLNTLVEEGRRLGVSTHVFR